MSNLGTADTIVLVALILCLGVTIVTLLKLGSILAAYHNEILGISQEIVETYNTPTLVACACKPAHEYTNTSDYLCLCNDNVTGMVKVVRRC